MSFVDINDNASDHYPIPAGVPQGSLLSPHLFNIFINGIPTPKNCNLAIYADDTALFTNVPSQDIDQLISNLEYGLKKINKYFSDWKIKINKSKTEAIVFTHSTIMQKKLGNRKLSFNNIDLEWEDNVKYLGIHLDKKLTMACNIAKSISKAKKRISTLYPLLHKKSGVNLHSKLTLYRSYIRPILTYACPVFSNSAKTHILKLQRATKISAFKIKTSQQKNQCYHKN